MSPTLRIVLCFFGLEAVFAPLITAAFLSALGLDEGAGIAVGIIVVFHVIRFTLVMGYVVKVLRPFEVWRKQSDPDDDDTLAAARAVYRLPYTFGVIYTATWVVAVPVMMAVLLGVYADQAPLDPHTKFGMVLLALAFLGGPTAYAFPTVEWLLTSDFKAVSLRLQARGIKFRSYGMSLGTRFMAFALAVACAITTWLGGIDYLNSTRSRSSLEAAAIHNQTLELALAMRPGGSNPAADRMALVLQTPGAFLLSTDARADAAAAIVGGERAHALADASPALMRQVRAAAGHEATGKLLQIQSGVAVSYTHVDAATVLGVIGDTDVGAGRSFWVMQIPFFVLVALWAPISAFLLSRNTVAPLHKLSTIVEDIRRGKVAAAERVAIYHHDETGKLSVDVNGMVDVLRTLSDQASAIGTGDLSGSFSIGGDLGEAFRAQLESLRTIVAHLSQNAMQLSAAATELYAASQEQETAAGHQSAGVNEVSKTMESLLTAASHISEATQGVLGKAERTRETTDRTAQRIGELSAHAGRIGEILEVIREIADRSDLLALNASLEGTRAGDAGRSFTLVAAEMRKLAERVMASVHDIKQLVADVRASVASTIMVTEESAKLADGTTESARQISLVTQQQSSGTEQAVQSMRDVASMLTQSLSATQQMRTLAANLKGQADQLSGVVARFKTSDGGARPA